MGIYVRKGKRIIKFVPLDFSLWSRGRSRTITFTHSEFGGASCFFILPSFSFPLFVNYGFLINLFIELLYFESNSNLQLSSHELLFKFKIRFLLSKANKWKCKLNENCSENNSCNFKSDNTKQTAIWGFGNEILKLAINYNHSGSGLINLWMLIHYELIIESYIVFQVIKEFVMHICLLSNRLSCIFDI